MGSSGRNKSFWLVAEWLKVKKLAEMGVTTSANDLPDELLESFLLLAGELTKLDNEALKRQARSMKRGGRGR